MTDDLVTIPTPAPARPEVERDWLGRPKVLPHPGAEKTETYTRCTTFVGCIDDTYKLGQWQQRHAIRGVALHDDLIAAVRDTDPEDRTRLNELADEAKTRSGAGDAARMGTYLHAVTEAADRGEDPGAVPLPWMSTGDLDPSAYLPDLAAYLEATAPLKAVHIERFCVQDPLKVGGTPDRVVQFQGKRYIADLKTGDIQWGALKIAAQLAMYARSRLYDPSTGEREAHGAEIDRGIVVHLPAGSGTCTLLWVDLLAGWEAVKVARQVREQRKVKFYALTTGWLSAEAPSTAAASVQGSLTLPGSEPTLEERIVACATRDEVTALWSAHARVWTEEHTAVAKAHIAGLGQ
jgi:hypothetical protein